MPRTTAKSTQRTPRKARAKRPKAPPGCWSLIPVDSRPIRERARRDYEKVLRDLEEARAEIEHFEKHDRPGFSQWLNRQFGSLLTELREAAQKLQAQRELICEIECEAEMLECSFARAYARVMWRHAHPEAEADVRFEKGQSGSGSGSRRVNGGGEDDFDGFFAEIEEEFARIFGGAPPHQRNQERADISHRSKPGRLRDLYRALARRLHPDAQEEMTWQKREWWHQTQAAYEEGDAERLQVILTLCEIEEQGTTAKTSVSLLMRITAEFKQSLRALRSQLAHHRRDPAWNFTKRKSQRDAAARAERSLRDELTQLKRAFDAAEFQLASWARQAQTLGTRAPGRRTRSYPRSYF